MKRRINLLPPELRKKEKSSAVQFRVNWKLITVLILPMIIWKLSAHTLTMNWKNDLNKIQGELNSYSDKISTLKTSVEIDLKAKKEKVETIKSELAKKEKELSDLGGVGELATHKGRMIYDLLKLIAENISNEVWLYELYFDKDSNNFSLKGYSLSHPKIGSFLAKVGNYPFIKDLYVRQSQIVVSTENKQNIIQFEADGKLNI